MHGPIWDSIVARLLFGVNPDAEHLDESNSTLEELQAVLSENQKPAPTPLDPLAPGEIPGGAVPGNNGAPPRELQQRLDQILGK
jgi:hypothetical protein